MGPTQDTHEPTDKQGADLKQTELCLREILDRAFTGWMPADQTLERLMDRMEERR